MKKMSFLRPLTLSFLLLGPLAAEEKPVDITTLQAERERLIDIVIELEGSFAETLTHYKILQNDFSSLKVESGKKVAPEEVAQLRAQLEKQAAILRDKQIKETATAADQQKTARSLALMRLDLGNLRRELHRERASMEAVGGQTEILKNMEGQLTDLKNQLQKSQGDGNKLQEQVTELTRARDEARTNLEQMAKALAGEKEARQKAEQKVAQLDQGMAKHREQTQAALADMQKKFEAEKAALVDAQNRMGKVDELEKNLQKMAERGEIWSKEEQILKQNIEELKAAKKELSQRVGKMGELNAKVQKSREDALRKVGELEKTHGDAMQKAASSQASLELEIARQKEAMSAVDERLSKMEAMQIKIAELEKQAADFQSKVKTLEGKLATTTSEKENLDDQLKQVQSEHEKDKQQQAAMEKKIQDLEGKKAQLDANMQTLQKELSAKDEALKSALAEAEEVQRLRSEIDKKDTELKKVRNELGQLHLKSEMATQQLVGLKMRIAEIKPVTYQMGAADVKGQQERVLSDMKECLAMFPNARFEIVGHTCDVGTAEANQRLSTERAASLRAFLVEKGISSEVVKSHGEGESHPLVPNASEENRRKNRRVEIHILD